MTPKFIHLNLHTEFSIVDGIVRLEPLMQSCVDYDMPAIALTDQSNLFALVKFYREAIANGIKPIIGTDVWLEGKKIILLAQTQIGYKNIVKILSQSYIENQKLGVPTVKREWLEELADGIIVLSGGKDGEIGQALLKNDQAQVATLLDFWQKNFPNRFYLELQRTGKAREEQYIDAALAIAVERNIPVVATNAVRFLKPEDFEAHEARVCIHDGYVLVDPNRPHLYTDQQYLRTPDEMVELFADIPEAVTNTVEIAKRCNVELTLNKTFLPIFPVPIDTTPEIYFASEAHKGLSAKFNNNVPEEYSKRLEFEIGVINQMGFASYFLIVADFIRWAKNNAIPVGPGRGSGAGSLVAYALKITGLDPIEHELLFERFLNPERVSLPDFDIDFCMDGRDRVIEYVMQRYGKDKVAQIITYGTMAARAVVRDVGRVFGHPYGFVDKLAKLIPFELGITLEHALEAEALLQERYKKEEEVKTLIDLAQTLEGITRNAGKHAGGVVIAPTPLTDFTPLYCEAEGDGIVTQLDKDDVETIGLVKFDFLGLRTLTIINLALQTINAKRQKNNEPPIDIVNIPLDDKATYKLLQACNTTAVFQFESRISRDLINRFLPDCFSDIVALGAMIRPGVLQSGQLDDIVDRKRGRAQISYLHPKLEPVLRQTYGVPIYQEQVMQMAQVLAGYSLGGADLLRRAMGKKKPEEMALQRAVFIDGTAKNNIDKHIANTIFDTMEKFAGYGFNKSHSAAYALISYQTAWLKAHYPAEFMAAVLSSDMDNTDKVVFFINDCKKFKLKINSPNINQSNYQFTVNDQNEIVYGLGAIKGVGAAAIEGIIANRNQKGPFKNMFDLCQHADVRKVNKRVLEALIFSGALDSIIPNRASALASLPLALKGADQHAHHQASRQFNLFDEDEIEYIHASEWSNEERLKNEKSVLGYYLDGHPIERYAEELSKFTSGCIAELAPEASKSVKIAGCITAIKIVNTKSGKRLAIVSLEDATGKIDVTLFDESFNEARSLLVEDQLVIAEGEVAFDNFSDSYRIRATKIMSLDQARVAYLRALALQLTPVQIAAPEEMQKLYEILEKYKGGKCPVIIYYKNGEAFAKLLLGDNWRVCMCDELLSDLRVCFGDKNVALMYQK